MSRISIATIAALVFAPFSFVVASVSISEIMYAPKDADAGREWVEVQNDGGDTDLAAWKFAEGGTNHGLAIIQGSAVIHAGGYAIIADNAAKFLEEFPSYAGALFDSSFSLLNDGETLVLKDGNLNVIDSVAYEAAWGGKDDGNSLQKSGGSFVPASPTPGNPGAAGNSAPLVVGTSTSPSSNGGGSAPVIVEPQVFVNAGADRVTIVGADIAFEGKAYGLEQKPLENARYMWNFGDGTTSEGKKVSHAYQYPGEYIVVLDVASGYFAGSDRLKVAVENSKVFISSLGDGNRRFVELRNDSNHELDISG